MNCPSSHSPESHRRLEIARVLQGMECYSSRALEVTMQFKSPNSQMDKPRPPDISNSGQITPMYTHRHPDLQEKNARTLLSKPHVFTPATEIILSFPKYLLLGRHSGREAHRCAGALGRTVQGELKNQVFGRSLHSCSYQAVPHMGLWPRSRPLPSLYVIPASEKEFESV